MASEALLISQDANVQGVLARVLGELDLHVESCSDLGVAAGKIAEHHYAAIVVDVANPSEAERILKQIRLSRLNKESMAIGLVDAQGSARSTFSVGANLILYRPVSEERARASVRAAAHLIKRENRRHPRLPVHALADVSYPSVESAAATLLDVSEEGLAFQCQQKLPSKGKVYFRFRLPGQARFIQLSGDLKWQDASGRAGIHFIDVPKSAGHLLKQWLESQKAEQEQKIKLDVAAPPGPAPSPADRRTESRIACRLGAEVFRAGSDVPHRCSLTDVSAGGCYVELPSPFPSGTAVEIAVRASDFKFRSRGTVQVAHPGFGMGVAFGVHTPEQSAQVQQLIRMVHQDHDATVRL